MSKVIYFFKHNEEKCKYKVFSNWFHSDIIDENKKKYWCGEQYIMAKKAELFGDNKMFEKIMGKNVSQSQIKEYGRQVSGFDEKTWEKERENIAYKCIKLRFDQDENFREILLSTKNKIIAEVNPKDLIWSIGITEKDSEKGKKWRGLTC